MYGLMNTPLVAEAHVERQQSDKMLEAFFYALLLVPSLVMVALRQSSMAAGLTLYLVCLNGYLAANSMSAKAGGKRYSFIWQRALFLITLLAFLLLHALWPMTTNATFQVARFFGSYLVMALMCFGALGLAKHIHSAPPSEVSRWVSVALWLLTINALVGLTGFKPFPQATIKPIGIFAEPSHLAMVLAPLLAYTCAIEARHHRSLLAFFFAWGVAIENLTTLVVVVLCFLITFRLSVSRVALVMFAAAGLFFVDVEYFASRLLISGDSDNISVLVLLQGWETATLMFEKTGGWGSGFQQFGFSNVAGEIADKLSAFGEDNLNQFDGGSTAAKIIGEFGIFGLVGLAVVVVLVAGAFLRLRAARQTGDNGGGLLLAASLYSFLIELFARGVGYFSPTFFLALSALVGIICFNNQAKLDRCPAHTS